MLGSRPAAIRSHSSCLHMWQGWVGESAVVPSPSHRYDEHHLKQARNLHCGRPENAGMTQASSGKVCTGGLGRRAGAALVPIALKLAHAAGRKCCRMP